MTTLIIVAIGSAIVGAIIGGVLMTVICLAGEPDTGPRYRPWPPDAPKS
jgi:hypothetical protein